MKCLSLLLSLSILTSCFLFKKKEEATSQTPAASKTPVVVIKAVTPKEMAETFEYPAKVEPGRVVSLSSEQEGDVRRVFHKVGDSVARGEILFEVVNPDPGYSYRPSRITAPFRGVLAQIEVDEGARVEKGKKLASFADLSKIKIVIEIPASERKYLPPGTGGELIGQMDKQKIASCKVVTVSPMADPITGTFQLELAPQSPEAKSTLIPGATVRALFKVNPRHSITIEEDHLSYKNGKPHGVIVNGKKAQYVPVKLGRHFLGEVEVLEGLQPGMSLIVQSSGYIADGDEVTVENPKDLAKGALPQQKPSSPKE